MPHDLIPSAEAAALLRLPISTFHERVRAGAIEEAVKMPGLRGARMFDRAYIEQLAEEAKAADLAKWDAAPTGGAA